MEARQATEHCAVREKILKSLAPKSKNFLRKRFLSPQPERSSVFKKENICCHKLSATQLDTHKYDYNIGMAELAFSLKNYLCEYQRTLSKQKARLPLTRWQVFTNLATLLEQCDDHAIA